MALEFFSMTDQRMIPRLRTQMVICIFIASALMFCIQHIDKLDIARAAKSGELNAKATLEDWNREYANAQEASKPYRIALGVIALGFGAVGAFKLWQLYKSVHSLKQGWRLTSAATAILGVFAHFAFFAARNTSQ